MYKPQNINNRIKKAIYMLVAKKRKQHLPFLMESIRAIRTPFAENKLLESPSFYKYRNTTLTSRKQ